MSPQFSASHVPGFNEFFEFLVQRCIDTTSTDEVDSIEDWFAQMAYRPLQNRRLHELYSDTSQTPQVRAAAIFGLMTSDNYTLADDVVLSALNDPNNRIRGTAADQAGSFAMRLPNVKERLIQIAQEDSSEFIRKSALDELDGLVEILPMEDMNEKVEEPHED